MKVLIMLVAIYALIINQSLKQKEREITSSQAEINNKQPVLVNKSHLQTAVVTTPPRVPRINATHKSSSKKNYREFPFKSAQKSETHSQHETLYPISISFASSVR